MPEPPPEPAAAAAREPLARRAGLVFTNHHAAWDDPHAGWVREVEHAVEVARAVDPAAGPDRVLRLVVGRETRTAVLGYALHWLTAFFFPRSTEVEVSVLGQVREGDAVVAQSVARASTTGWTSLGLLFYPPSWPSWTSGAHREEHPVLIQAVAACTRRVLADLAAEAAPPPPPPPLAESAPPGEAPPATAAAPLGEPPPNERGPRQTAPCPDCGEPVERGWVACPWCGATLATQRER